MKLHVKDPAALAQLRLGLTSSLPSALTSSVRLMPKVVVIEHNGMEFE